MATAKPAKSSAASSAAPKVTYKDMIKSAIIALKERNGSSRQALKKYVQSNNDIKTANFDALFNTALRKGVESGDFLQPKGPSGPVKAAKKEKPVTAQKVKKPAAAKKATKKPAAAKKVTKKAAAPKKVTKKAAAPKRVAAPKKVVKKTATKKATTTTTKKAAPKKKTTTKKSTK